ncbi:MAG: hypothetical protein KA436_06670, partial [Oligoflexales bacterium]|nr:hypothetical protein [Oligoflexales bacterium]
GFAGDMQQAVQAFSTAFAKTGRPPYGAGKPDDRHSGGHRSRESSRDDGFGDENDDDNDN